ncbi:MAG: hypothetical protein R6V25_07770 [Desulfatiglandales bacterium]
MVFFANLGVNLRGCLCGVLQYASAQPLDFLDLDKKSSFLNWKLPSAQKAFLDGHWLGFLNSLIDPPAEKLESFTTRDTKSTNKGEAKRKRKHAGSSFLGT